jgi:hypothetical protein
MNVLAGKIRAAAAISTLPLLLLAACSHATKPVPPPVTLGFCGSDQQTTPDVVLVVCNTDDITARNLIWSDWGKATATAKGSATVDLCAYIDCASGEYSSVPIEMTASEIVHCSKNTRAYSVLRYAFPKGSPFQGVPGDVQASFGQGESVPPPNQTVSLTC